MEMTVPNILSLAQFSEYITAVNIGKHNALNGGDINETWARTIYMERMAVQNRYNLNPSDSTLQGTANYLFSILRYISQATTAKNNLAGTPPAITGPANQSVNVGDTATFSVSVTGTAPFTYQWLLGGVPIPGATNSSLVLTNAQLSQSGGLYSVQVTNPVTTVTSNTATLTVTASIQGFFTYSPTVDFYPILQGNSDPFSYGTSFSITHNATIVIALPNTMPANQYMLAKIPIGESVKTVWNNTPLNNGNIPDPQFEAIVQFGGFTYYASRGQISMDTTSTLTLS